MGVLGYVISESGRYLTIRYPDIWIPVEIPNAGSTRDTIN